MYIGYVIIGVIFAAISSWVGAKLKSKFRYYSQVSLRNGMSGKEIAEKMLHDHGITDVKVISVSGQLTDHYNPRNKTVNLSEPVYMQRNAAAAAVAAHECGHAVQHAQAYQWLTLRSKLVPVVNIGAKAFNIVIMVGIGILATTGNPLVAWLGVALFATTTLFSLITLPVEYDASNRALKWMQREHIVTDQEHSGAKDSLKWAARTYLVAAIGSIATLLYLVFNIAARR
ncbi:hypothetical protein C7377_0511 [Balneicella halophila]|uniref:Zinc metallopeptidase n=1 Tax=Balneicella halophila TaxID=1537566 RepID=A0A7L4UT33_BALHA|nr:zinc metallopeptidase [Balneicella halophila]PVX52204.1 hypothetical protein C7377_0511 [Balneicella halophila]